MSHNVQSVHSMGDWSSLLSNTKQFGGKSLVVDFSAVWCGPCKAISPVFEQLSTQYSNVTFVKVDVDEVAELAGQAGVKAMPTFQAYFNGEKVDELVGADKNKLKQMIETASARGGGAGRTLGGTGGNLAGGAAAPSDDSPEARRARALAAVEARMK